MIVLSLTLLGFAIADLLRWSPDPVSWTRTLLATCGATATVVLVAALSGVRCWGVVLSGGAVFVVLVVWLSWDRLALGRKKPGASLAWICAVLLVAFAAGGAVDPVSGSLARWYANLDFAFVRSVPIDQFVLGLSAALFLLGTTNRIVRLVLQAAGTPAEDGEATLRGGRLLGPMERLLVGAMVVAGDLTGAAIVITAKGLLRLPEIRNSAEQEKGVEDHVTEYFLIGTFCSLLVAGGLGAVVLGSA